MTRLRVALTLSGAVSLGAYEGGALAALLVAVQALNTDDAKPPAVTIDLMGGASAGSITALLAARVLTKGMDPIRVMRQAWVIDDDITNMRAFGTAAPLSVDRLREGAKALFEPPKGAPYARHQDQVTVRMILAALRGLSYEIHGLDPFAERGQAGGEEPMPAITYVDWADIEVKASMATADFTTPKGTAPVPVDVALASGATSLGFPPVVINRIEDRDRYKRIKNLPDSNSFWYTDGGTIDNQPLRRTADKADEIDYPKGRPHIPSDEHRLHVLITPHPSTPPTNWDLKFADPNDPPSWTAALMRAYQVSTAQSLSADLGQIVRTNSRIRWAKDLRETLDEVVGTLPPGNAEALRQQIGGVLNRIRAEKKVVHEDAPAPLEIAAAPAPDLADALTEILQRIGAFARDDPIAVSLISPLPLVPVGKKVEDVLAGEFGAHFGGFLDQHLRRSDFWLGYQSTQWWVDNRLKDFGMSPAEVTIALTAMEAAALASGIEVENQGTTTFATLPLPKRLAAVPTILQYVHVVANDVIQSLLGG
jgi:predicted acylesterase/phospholipase RssA